MSILFNHPRLASLILKFYTQYTTTSNLITTDAPEIEQSTTLATEQTTPVSMPSLRYQPTDNDDQYVEYLLNRLQERLHPQVSLLFNAFQMLDFYSKYRFNMAEHIDERTKGPTLNLCL